MRWYVPEKMRKLFRDRTAMHISLVQKYCLEIAKHDEDRFGGLVERGERHDQSKYREPEMIPYVFITWQYKCKKDGVEFDPPEDMKKKMNDATEHHVRNNRHHPEFHDEDDLPTINREDRDAPPARMVDATGMDDLDVAEMVADWLAMSEEKDTDPREWAEKNVNKRWKFNEHQVNLIHELIDAVWDK